MDDVWVRVLLVYVLATSLSECLVAVGSGPYRVKGRTSLATNTCFYNGRAYSRGKFRVAPCVLCECTGTGRTRCWAEACLKDPGCIRYAEAEGRCCPECIQYGCRYNGSDYARGQPVDTGDACRRCFCPRDHSDVRCLPVYCPPTPCVDAKIPSGQCCPVCPSGPNCWLRENDIVIPVGMQVWVDKCHICYCPGDAGDQTTPTPAIRASLVNALRTGRVGVQHQRTRSREITDRKKAVCAFKKSYICDEPSG